jgi:amidase
VLTHEARAGVGEYLRRRGIAGLESLADVIRFNEREAAREMRWWGQELMLLSEATDGLKSRRYLEAKQRAQHRAGAEGIDATLFQHRLDAIVAVTSGPAFTIDLVNGDNGGSMLSCARPAAVAGYPHITVPAGFVHGLPVGVSFMASAWRDAKLLGLAHAFELAHGARRPPQFHTTIHD